MKKIMINGTPYNAKRLYGIGVSSKGAMFLKHKEKVLFSKGLVAIWFENAPTRYYVVGEVKDLILYYYNPDDGTDEIIFFEEKLQQTWEKIFVFLFDDDGACFLTATKRILQDVGAFCYIGDASRVDDIKSCAWNQAGLSDSELLARLIKLDSLDSGLNEKGTFLEVNYEG